MKLEILDNEVMVLDVASQSVVPQTRLVPLENMLEKQNLIPNPVLQKQNLNLNLYFNKIPR